MGSSITMEEYLAERWCPRIGTFQAYLSQNDLKVAINQFLWYDIYVADLLMSSVKQNYSAGEIGWIFGTHAFLAFLCGVQIGMLTSPEHNSTGQAVSWKTV